MRALWPGTEKTEWGEGKATCHRDRKAGGTLRCHQDWRCSPPSRREGESAQRPAGAASHQAMTARQ
jgi:hypothetical protein